MGVISEVYWDPGERPVNQDSVSLQEVRLGKKRAVLALICDGIGGLWEGETASGFVAEQMTEWFYREALLLLQKNKSRKKIEKSGLRALYGCNAGLREYAKREGKKLGTTADILLLWGRRYFLWHCGDTRVYRMAGRRKEPERLTEDHTLDGQVLTRCIGSFEWKEPDVRSGRYGRNTVFLLCSDGFRNRIGEDRIGETMQPAAWRSGEQVYMRLKEIAGYVKKRGEKDNISAVAIKTGG